MMMTMMTDHVTMTTLMLTMTMMCHHRRGAVTAVFTGPLLPEMSNGTFHHFFVPDGDYEDNDDPERCHTLFRFLDERHCGGPGYEDEGGDAVVRDDFIITKHQVEDAARLLESIGRTVSHDLDGQHSYGTFLQHERSQISEAFGSVDQSLLELEVKFKQSQENDAREEHQLTGNVLRPIQDVRDTLRDAGRVSAALRDKHELLSLVIRSHGTRLSRLKTEYLNL